MPTVHYYLRLDVVALLDINKMHRHAFYRYEPINSAALVACKIHDRGSAFMHAGDSHSCTSSRPRTMH
jgi:hypothetical protein